MISKVTESNKELIKARMHEINEAFKAKAYKDAIEAGLSEADAEAARDAAFQIEENLESYYANIVQIAKLATDFHDAPYKFFLMPLDEPLFEIDANKRTITVPNHFAKNGVGVYGDHMAEVLYFRIDKYFDYQDLFEVDEIVINWQFRPANASRNAEIKTEPSIALAPDDTYDPGHIVFGWVITNDMTPSKGTLTFSVSFIKRNGDEYQYVLNTTTASVAINDSLVLDDPKKLDSLSRPVFERLSDSRYTEGNIVPLIDPVYRTNPVVSRVDGVEVIEYKGLPETANFEINANTGVEADEVILQTIGYASDDGNIKYTWHGTTTSGVSVDREPEGLTYPNDYVLTPDTEEDSRITYYINVDGAMCPFDKQETIDNKVKRYYQEEEGSAKIYLEDALADINTNVYEAGSHLIVNEAGQYQVIMQSKKTISGITNTINSGNVPSRTCTVPMAAVPAVDLTVLGKVAFDNNEEFKNGNLIKFADSDYTFVDGEAPQVIANISIDESKIWDNVERTGVQGVTAGSSIGAIALVMTNAEGDEGKPQAADFASMQFKTKVTVGEDDDAVTYSVTKDGGSLPVDSVSATGEGFYKVYAVNRRNHTYNVSDTPAEDKIINISQVAPMLSGIKLVAKAMGDESGDIDVLIDNEAQLDSAAGQGVGIFGEDSRRQFEVIISDTLKDAVELQLSVVEVKRSGEIVPLAPDYAENGEVLPNEYVINPIEGVPGHYAFSIGEGGRFVIKAVTKYHGTQRITLSDPFMILAQ